VRFLVTGGAGFIGSNVVDALIADGGDVVVLDDLSTGYAANIHPRAELMDADIGDVEVLRQAVQGCDVVFHQAAHRAVFRSMEHPLATDRANVAGTLSVLIAARDAGVRRVVNASSSSVYGGAEQLPTPENAPPLPRSPYAVTKLAGEHYCRVFWEQWGLETVSLRYFNVYGPRQRPDSLYAAVIPLFIDAIREGRSPEIHGDGHQSRDFTFISDIVAANIKAATAPTERCAGRAFNIAGGAAYSLLDLVMQLQEILGVEAHPVHTAPRPGDVRHTCADVSAARSDLDFEAMVSFAAGLRQTVGWFGERSP